MSSTISACLKLARVDKPAGFFLGLWPNVWGLTMAAYSKKLDVTDYGFLLLKTASAAFVIRSAGCTINDIFDRKFDASVARTKSRPLASGKITVFAACLFLLLQYIVGTCIFATFNKHAFYANMTQMLPLAGAYPLMKRVTYWPQAWLGLAMNFGFVSSWVAVHDTPLFHSKSLLFMMFGLWCWTMVYDTVYACMDKKDDVKIGIGSTALFFGESLRMVIASLSILFVALLVMSGKTNGQGLPYYAICVGGAVLFFISQLWRLDVDSVPTCWKFFCDNAYYLGIIVYAGLLLDYLMVTV